MMDFVLEAWVSGLIELNKLEWMLGAGNAWKPGDEAEAALRRIQRHAQHRLRCARRGNRCARCAAFWARRIVALSVMTQNFDLTRGYFGDARQVHLPDVFPPFLHSEVPQERRRGRLRRLDVQEQIRQRAHHR